VKGSHAWLVQRRPSLCRLCRRLRAGTAGVSRENLAVCRPVRRPPDPRVLRARPQRPAARLGARGPGTGQRIVIALTRPQPSASPPVSVAFNGTTPTCSCVSLWASEQSSTPARALSARPWPSCVTVEPRSTCRHCRVCLIATATVLELPPIGSSHAPTSCPCTGRNGSGQVALPLVVPSERPIRLPETTASTGSSSAPVDRPHPCAPLSCMDRSSQPVAAASHGGGSGAASDREPPGACSSGPLRASRG
jgi:hypothetical protein